MTYYNQVYFSILKNILLVIANCTHHYFLNIFKYSYLQITIHETGIFIAVIYISRPHLDQHLDMNSYLNRFSTKMLCNFQSCFRCYFGMVLKLSTIFQKLSQQFKVFVCLFQMYLICQSNVFRSNKQPISIKQLDLFLQIKSTWLCPP